MCLAQAQADFLLARAATALVHEFGMKKEEGVGGGDALLEDRVGAFVEQAQAAQAARVKALGVKRKREEAEARAAAAAGGGSTAAAAAAAATAAAASEATPAAASGQHWWEYYAALEHAEQSAAAAAGAAISRPSSTLALTDIHGAVHNLPNAHKEAVFPSSPPYAAPQPLSTYATPSAASAGLARASTMLQRLLTCLVCQLLVYQC